MVSGGPDGRRRGTPAVGEGGHRHGPADPGV